MEIRSIQKTLKHLFIQNTHIQTTVCPDEQNELFGKSDIHPLGCETSGYLQATSAVSFTLIYNLIKMCEIPFSSLSKYNPICTIQVDDNRKTIPLNNFIYTYTMLPFL